MSAKFTTIAIAILFLATPLAAVGFMGAEATHGAPFQAEERVGVTSSVSSDGDVVTVHLDGANAARNSDGTFDGSASNNAGKVITWNNIGWLSGNSGLDSTNAIETTACAVQIAGTPQDTDPFAHVQATETAVESDGDLVYSFALSDCESFYGPGDDVSRYEGTGPGPSLYVSVDNGGNGRPVTYLTTFNPCGAIWNAVPGAPLAACPDIAPSAGLVDDAFTAAPDGADQDLRTTLGGRPAAPYDAFAPFLNSEFEFLERGDGSHALATFPPGAGVEVGRVDGEHDNVPLDASPWFARGADLNNDDQVEMIVEVGNYDPRDPDSEIRARAIDDNVWIEQRFDSLPTGLNYVGFQAVTEDLNAASGFEATIGFRDVGAGLLPGVSKATVFLQNTPTGASEDGHLWFDLEQYVLSSVFDIKLYDTNGVLIPGGKDSAVWTGATDKAEVLASWGVSHIGLTFGQLPTNLIFDDVRLGFNDGVIENGDFESYQQPSPTPGLCASDEIVDADSGVDNEAADTRRYQTGFSPWIVHDHAGGSGDHTVLNVCFQRVADGDGGNAYRFDPDSSDEGQNEHIAYEWDANAVFAFDQGAKIQFDSSSIASGPYAQLWARAENGDVYIFQEDLVEGTTVLNLDESSLHDSSATGLSTGARLVPIMFEIKGGDATGIIDDVRTIGFTPASQSTASSGAGDGFTAEFILPRAVETPAGTLLRPDGSGMINVTVKPYFGTGGALGVYATDPDYPNPLSLGVATIEENGVEEIFNRAFTSNGNGEYSVEIGMSEIPDSFLTPGTGNGFTLYVIDENSPSPGDSRLSNYFLPKEELLAAGGQAAAGAADLSDDGVVVEGQRHAPMTPVFTLTSEDVPCNGTCDQNDGWFHIITPQNATVIEDGQQVVVRPAADGKYVFHQEVFAINSANSEFERMNLQDHPAVKYAYLSFNTASQAAENAAQLPELAGIGDVFGTSDGTFLDEGAKKEYRIDYETFLAHGMIVGDPNDPQVSRSVLLEPTAIWSGVWYSPFDTSGSQTRVGWDESNAQDCQAATGNGADVTSVCPESGGFFNLIKNELVGTEGENGAAMKNVAGFIDVPDLFEYFITPVTATSNSDVNHYLYIDTPDAFGHECGDLLPGIPDVACMVTTGLNSFVNGEYGRLAAGDDNRFHFFAMPYTNDGHRAGGPESDVDEILFFATQNKQPEQAPFDAIVTAADASQDWVLLGRGQFDAPWNRGDGAYVIELSPAELDQKLLAIGGAPGEDITFYVYAYAEDESDKGIPGKSGAYGWQKATFHLGGQNEQANLVNNLASPFNYPMPDRSVVVTPLSLEFDEGDAMTPGHGDYSLALTNAPAGVVAIDVSLSGDDPAVFELLACDGTGTALQSPVTLTDMAPRCVRVQVASLHADSTAIEGIFSWSASVDHVVDDTATTDDAYDGTAVDSVSVTAREDDTNVAVLITESEGSTDVAEGSGVTDSYTLVLGSQPTKPVVVRVEADAPGQLELTGSAGVKDGEGWLFTFVPSDWDQEQTLIVGALDDDQAEGAPDDEGFSYHTVSIDHETFSTDSAYHQIPVDPVVVTIEDNDVVGISIHEASGSTDVVEGGATDTYQISLDSDVVPALGIVEVLLCPDPQVTVSAAGQANARQIDANTDTGPCETPGGGTQDATWRILFTSADYDQPRTVTVTAADDAVDEETPHDGHVYHQVAVLTTDGRYDGAKARPLDVTITDNDVAALVVDEDDGLSVAEEGSTSDTFTVALATEPIAVVDVDLAGDGQLSISPGSLAFTASNWDQPQTVTVTANDDGSVEDPHPDSLIDVAAASADANYEGLTDQVSVSIQDNDEIGLDIDDGDGVEVDEDGATTDTYQIRLGAQPASDSPVTVAVTPDAQVAIAAIAGTGTTLDAGDWTIEFTDEDWADWRMVTVEAVDDNESEADPHAGAVSNVASQPGGPFDGKSTDVAVDVHDDDVVGIIIEESDGSTEVNEAGETTDTYTVRLGDVPSSEVVVTISTDEQIEIASVTDDVDGDEIWTITFAADDTALEPRTVTVKAVNDTVAEGNPHTGIVTHSASQAAGGEYDTLTEVLEVAVIDDESPDIRLEHPDGSPLVTEDGQTDEYDIRLSHQPTSSVEMTVSPDAQVQIDGISGDGASPNADGTSWTIIFSTENFGDVRTITVSAFDDPDDEEVQHNGTITHTATQSAGDQEYDGLSKDLDVDVIDNDGAGIRIDETNGGTAVAEAGSTTDTFDVQLTVQPVGTVVVKVAVEDSPAQTTISSDDGTAVSDTHVEFVFTPLDFADPRTVTVTAVDDGKEEDDTHTSSIKAEIVAASSDGAVTTMDDDYLAALPEHVVVSVADDDEIGFFVDPTGEPLTVSEAGETSDSYAIRIGSQPEGVVTVTVQPPAGSQVTLADGDGNSGADGTVSFTWGKESYKEVFTVVATAVDDGIAEDDPHTVALTHTIQSPVDTDYANEAIGDIAVSITDNDIIALVLDDADGVSVDEADVTASDSYTFRLGSMPTANVEVTLATDGQTSIDLTDEDGAVDNNDGTWTVTIEPAEWDQARTVTVTAVDDEQAEGAHTSDISHDISSTDTDYDALPTETQQVSVADNDNVGLVITETDGTSVAEGSADTDKYTIQLGDLPETDVTVLITPDSQVTIDLTGEPGAADNNDGTWTVTFTSTDGTTPRTVTVGVFEDLVAEGNPHDGIITHDASQTGGPYNGLSEQVNVEVADNDAKALLIEESGDGTTVSEDGTTNDDYTIRLENEPTSSVAVTIAPDAQVEIDLSGATNAVDNLDGTWTVTFTPGDFDEPRTVTVSAADDPDPEEPTHPGTITHTASQPAGHQEHDGLTATLTATVIDNDGPRIVVAATGDGTTVEEEGITDDINVRLSDQPSGTVVVKVHVADTTPQTEIASSEGTQVSSTEIEFVFTPVDFDQAKTVTITAVDDGIVEDEHSSLLKAEVVDASGDGTFTTMDEDYKASLPVEIPVVVLDDDFFGVIIEQSDGTTSVDEAGETSDTYTIRLGSQPSAPVNVVVNVPAGNQIEVTDSAGDPATGGTLVLTFFNNYDTPQEVIVTAVDDQVDEDTTHQVTLTHTSDSTDENYDGLTDIDDVVVSITDDDVAGVIVTESDGTTEVAESGETTDTYTLQLSSAPTASVTITVHPPADGQVTLADDLGNSNTDGTVSVVFDASNFDQPQTVEVTAIDDTDMETDPHTATITHTVTSSDTDYGGAIVDDVVVSITDDDGIVVSVEATDADASETSSDSGTFTVTRVGSTVNDLTVPFTLSGTATVLDDYADPGTSVTIPAGQTSATVTITPVQDDVDEGDDETVVLTLDADPASYTLGTPSSDTVTIADDDTAGATVTESGGSTEVSEDGATDTYTIVLDSKPTADVVVTIGTDTQVTTDVSAVTFTFENWNVAQTVTVSAVDDDDIESSPHTGTVSHSVTSDDTIYGAPVPVDDVTVQITDNDEATDIPCDRDQLVYVCVVDEEGTITSLIPGDQGGISIRIGPFGMRL